MKRFKNTLKKSGWALRIFLFILFILWACQLAGSIKDSMKKNIERSKNWDYNKACEVMQEFYEFRGELYKKALEKGKDYSPSMYFADIAAIEREEEELKIEENSFFISRSHQNDFFELMRKNLIARHFTFDELENAREKYLEENEDLFYYRQGLVHKIGPFNWSKVFPFVLTFYLRTTLIMLFLYLVRLSERTSSTILGTILGDKKRFFFAIILWPIYFFKYPYNVVREIRVEAELRRLKGLFRVFSTKEIKLVREIANSAYYKQWLADFRYQRKDNFKRGLFLALFATLVLHLLISFNFNFSERIIRNSRLISYEIEDRVENGKSLVSNTDENNHQVEEWGVLSDPIFLEPLLPIITLVFLKQVVCSRQPNGIDYVPRIPLFGNLVEIVNQTRKGNENEYDQKNNLLGCHINWGNRGCLR